MEQTKEKFKDYFFKVFDFLHGKDLKTRIYKLIILLGLTFLTELNISFSTIALITTIAFVVVEWDASSIVWVCITGILSGSITSGSVNWSIYVLCAILLIKFILKFMAKKVEWKNWRFLAIFSLYVLIVLTLLLPLSVDYKFTAQFDKVPFFTLLVLMIYFVKELNITDCLYLFTLSVVAGGLVVCLADYCGGCKYVFDFSTYYSKGVVNRLTLFLRDPNFTGSVLVCGLASAYILHRRKKINNVLYFMFVAILGFFAIRTISKACLFIIALLGLFILIENLIKFIKTKDKKYLIELGVYLFIIGLVCAIEWKYVNALFYRFFKNTEGWWSEGEHHVAIDELTTGRFSLWMDYLKGIFGNKRILFFGVGLNAGYLGEYGPHNIIIEYLYRYGILICLSIVAIIIIGCIPYLKKCKFYNFVPTIIIWGIMCSICSELSRYFYIFALTYMTIVWNGVQKDEDYQISIDDELKQNVNVNYIN